jgi:hypothetical protein
MIEWAVVDWGDEVAPFHKLDKLDGDGCDLYAILTAARNGRSWMMPYRLLYIGLAYHQTVHARIRQDHRSYELVCAHFSANRDRDVIVMLGHLAAISTARITKPLVQDVEALLICENKPKFNKRNRETYSGRPLVLRNEGERRAIKMFAQSSTVAFNKWQREGGEDEMDEVLEKLYGPSSE